MFMKKNVQSRGEKRRQALLSAARTVMREGGFRELQMATVAAAAKVAVGTIYRYFPSKAELCAELVATVSQRELDVLREIAQSDGSAAERLRAGVESFAARAFRSGRVAYAVIAEPVDPEVEDVRLRYRAEIARVFRALLEERDGALACDDPDTASVCIVGAMLEGAIGPLSPDQEAGAAEIATAVRQIGAFCLGGVAARGGDVIEFQKHGQKHGQRHGQKHGQGHGTGGISDG